MKSPIGSPNREALARFRDMQDIGCLACRQDGRPATPGDVHHLLVGGRRLSHHASVCLCAWHHRAVPPAGMNSRQAEKHVGPSLARTPRAFRERYGSDVELLEMQNRLLDELRETR